VNEFTQLPGKVNEDVSEVAADLLFYFWCILLIKHYHLASRCSNDNSYSALNISFSICSFIAQRRLRKPNADDDEEVGMTVVMMLEFKQQSVDNPHHVSFKSANVMARVS